MSDQNLSLKDLFENQPLYSKIEINVTTSIYGFTSIKLKEVVFECEECDALKPFHNLTENNNVLSINASRQYYSFLAKFECVSCNISRKDFSIAVERLDKVENTDTCLYSVTKYGEYPLKPLPQNKELSKFLKKDKDEYAKAIRCLANGYGVAAFAYFRRIVETNITRILDLIIEIEQPSTEIVEEINKLRKESPVSDKIRIINSTLPGYLRPAGFNPLGTLYGVLSDGVHSLPENECLDKADDIRVCLEFIIGGLAEHKKNIESLKSRLNTLKTK